MTLKSVTQHTHTLTNVNHESVIIANVSKKNTDERVTTAVDKVLKKTIAPLTQNNLFLYDKNNENTKEIRHLMQFNTYLLQQNSEVNKQNTMLRDVNHTLNDIIVDKDREILELQHKIEILQQQMQSSLYVPNSKQHYRLPMIPEYNPNEGFY